MKNLFFFLIGLLSNIAANAQSTGVDMADTLRKDGKIYVVVTVVVILFVGLFIYLFLTDRKISRIEKEIKK